MARWNGRNGVSETFVSLLLLCSIVVSQAFLCRPAGWSQLHVQASRCHGVGGKGWPASSRNRERHRTATEANQLRASAAASPAGEPQQQRAETSLGMLDAAIAIPPTSTEEQDGSSSDSGGGGGGGNEFSIPAPNEHREIEDVGGGGVGGVKGRKKPKSLRGVFRRASSRALSYLTIMTTWIIFRFLLKGLNKVECHNRQALLDAVLDRGDRGLLTVSNHMCVYDDPGLWSALVPFWRTGRRRMRWALCTDDIYYAHPVLKNIFEAGRTLPIKRTRGMEQPLFQAFFQKLEGGEWGHIFAEGAIRQPWRFSRDEPILADFKPGIGRLLLRSEDPPLVLPMYHIGMHQIASEAPTHKRGRGKLLKIMPNFGRTVRVYVGEPIDVAPIIEKCRRARAQARGGGQEGLLRRRPGRVSVLHRTKVKPRSLRRRRYWFTCPADFMAGSFDSSPPAGFWRRRSQRLCTHDLRHVCFCYFTLFSSYYLHACGHVY
ncbi:unnamed protein product [Ectocarpus sp. 4 AP-2014]